MNKYLEGAFFISAKTQRDLLLYKNPFDNSVHVFVFIELNQKTANTPYHEFIGKDITQEITILNNHAFDANAFERRLEKLFTVNLRMADNNWVWIKAAEPTN